MAELTLPLQLAFKKGFVIFIKIQIYKKTEGHGQHKWQLELLMLC